MGTGFQRAEDIFTIFGPFHDEVLEIGYAVLFVFLILALIREFLKGFEGKSSYTGLFVRVLLIAGAMAIYTPFVSEITRAMELLANFFMPTEEFRESIQKVFAAYKQNRDLGMIAFVKMTFLEWMIQGTYNLAYAVMRGFGWIRLVFLSTLYIAGPIFLGVGVFMPNMASAWVRWLFEVSSWNVVFSLFVRVLTEMNFFEIYTQAQTPALEIFAMNAIVIVLIIFFVPMFSSMMMRGASGLSGAGAAIAGLGGALALRQIVRAKESVSHLKERPAERQNPRDKTNSYKKV